MSKPITIKDIASHVGVSTSAVSAVLSRKESRHVRVSALTRSRILEAAERLHYRPNQLARSLRGEQTNVIGVYTAYGYLNPYIPFTAQVVGGLHQGCDDNRKDLLLHGLYSGRPVEEIYGELADRRIDGLVVYTGPDDPLVNLLISNDLPVIGIIDALPGLPCVLADDAQGARLLVEHLYERGHREVVYIARNSPMVSALRRRCAFFEAAEAIGMSVRDCCPTAAPERFGPGDLDWLDLPRKHRPTAAACWNDNTAYNLLSECRLRDITLPDDLAVVGFDDTPPPSPTPWRLTTIRAPWTEVTRQAVNLLVSSLKGGELPAETALRVTLTVGDTT